MCLYSRVMWPVFRQRLDQVWPCGCQLIVNLPATGQLTASSLSSCFKTKQGYDVSNVGMEVQSIRGPCCNTDFLGFRWADKIFYVSEYLLRWPDDELTTAFRCNMRRNASINNNILFARVLINRDTTDYLESMAIMDFI